jgi:hypothetical protein
MAAGATARRLEWSPGALDAYLSTLARIAADDPFTAHQIAERGNPSTENFFGIVKVLQKKTRVRLRVQAQEN